LERWTDLISPTIDPSPGGDMCYRPAIHGAAVLDDVVMAVTQGRVERGGSTTRA
jgi:hypothetical protein